MSFTEIALLIQRRWKSITIIAGLSAVLFFMLGQLLVQYEARATVLIRPVGNVSTESKDLPVPGLVFSAQIDLLSKVGQTYTQLLGQRLLIRETIKNLGWDEGIENKGDNSGFIKQTLRLLVFGRPPSNQNPMERLVDRTKKKIKAGFVGKSSILEIKVRNSDAHKAADFANGLLNTFISHNQVRGHERIQTFRKRLELELQDCQTNLKERQARLHKLTKELGLPVFVNVTKERARIEKKLQTLEDANEKRRFNNPLLKFQLQHIEKNLDRFPEFHRDSYEKGENALIQQLKTQLFNLSLEKQRTLVDFNKEHHRVKLVEESIQMVNEELNGELAAILAKDIYKLDPTHKSLLQKQFTTETSLEVNAATNKEANIQIELYRQLLTDFESAAPIYRQLTHEIKNLETNEKLVLTKQIRAMAVSNDDFTEVEILDLAIVPRYPMIRNVPLLFFVILGFLFGTAFSTAFFVWKEETLRVE